MIDYLKDGVVVESFHRYPVSYQIDGIAYRVADLVAAGHDVEPLGFFARAYPQPVLAEGQYVDGFTLQVIDGRPVATPTVADKTAEQLAEELAARRAAMVVSPSQCRLALAQVDLLDSVTAMVAASALNVQVMWEFASVIERTNPLVVQLASALGLTEQGTDDLFTLAATL